MFSGPTFSIVIPTYNRAGFIHTAIESVINQKYNSWELIVVNDGGNDNTKEIVLSFKDERILHHYQENQELNAARNKGVLLSKGTYVCFLDDDDYYLPEFLTAIKTIIRAHESKVAIYRTGLVQKRGEVEVLMDNYKEEIHKNSTNFFLKYHSNLLGAAIHRDIFNEINFNEEYLLFEDLHFLVRVSLSFPLIQSDSHHAVYVRHETTRINQYYIEEDKINNCITCINDLFDKYGGEIYARAGKDTFSTTLSENYLMFSDKYLKGFKISKAIKYWLYAVSSDHYFKNIRPNIKHMLKIISALFKKPC